MCVCVCVHYSVLLSPSLSLSLKEAAGQEVAVPPATSKKQPVARTDSTMPILEEHSEPTTPATAVRYI